MSNILWEQPDGTLALTSIFDDSDPVECAALLQKRGDVPGDWENVSQNIEWFDAGWPHEAYRWDGEKIYIDIDAAKTITKNRLRAERVSLFSSNDIVLRDALIEGKADQVLTAKVERDRLRNLPETVDTMSDLKKLKLLQAEVD